MPNPFEQHGIEYLSPSAIGRLQDCMAYGLVQLNPRTKFSEPFGPALPRGTAVDRAITAAAYRPEAEDELLIEHALRVFDDECVRAQVDPTTKEAQEERASVPKYVLAALPEVRRWGPPEADQGKVEVRFEGIEVPMIGYYDLRYPTRLRELKSTKRMPGEASARHARQVCIYATATKREPWVSYVTPREMRSYPIPDVEACMAQVGGVLRSLRNLLSLSTDYREILASVAPNLDGFAWKSDVAREKARELWGY